MIRWGLLGDQVRTCRLLIGMISGRLQGFSIKALNRHYRFLCQQHLCHGVEHHEKTVII
jgi:hypothetical protein